MDVPDRFRRDDGVIELRLVRPYLGLLATAGYLGMGALVAALAIASLVSGEQAAFAIVGFPVAVGAVLRSIATWNRKIVIEDDRIGWSNGLTGPGSWVAHDDVVLAVYRQMGNPALRPQFGVLLLARRGGLGPIGRLLVRGGLDRETRARVRETREAHDRIGVLFLPFSELGEERATVLRDCLAERLPSGVGADAAAIIDRGWRRG